MTGPSAYSGVKVFSASKHADRDGLGEKVTAWVAAHPSIEVVDTVVSQSSDRSFHCISIVLLYKDRS